MIFIFFNFIFFITSYPNLWVLILLSALSWYLERISSQDIFFIEDTLEILHPLLKHMISIMIISYFVIIKINHKINSYALVCQHPTSSYALIYQHPASRGWALVYRHVASRGDALISWLVHDYRDEPDVLKEIDLWIKINLEKLNSYGPYLISVVYWCTLHSYF